MIWIAGMPNENIQPTPLRGLLAASVARMEVVGVAGEETQVTRMGIIRKKIIFLMVSPIQR
jgi:hypothetical protein